MHRQPLKVAPYDDPVQYQILVSQAEEAIEQLCKILQQAGQPMTTHHDAAVRRCVVYKGLAPFAVAHMVAGLTEAEAWGVANWLTWEQVAFLKTWPRIKMFVKMQYEQISISIDDVRNCNWFNLHLNSDLNAQQVEVETERLIQYGHVYYRYITNENLSSQEAVWLLDRLSEIEVKCVLSGCSTEEASILSQNPPKAIEWQVAALRRYRDNGLTAVHFQGCSWFNDASYLFAIGYLLMECRLEINSAMQALKGLDRRQAFLISTGIPCPILSKLTYDEVKMLDCWLVDGETRGFFADKPYTLQQYQSLIGKLKEAKDPDDCNLNGLTPNKSRIFQAALLSIGAPAGNVSQASSLTLGFIQPLSAAAAASSGSTSAPAPTLQTLR